MTSPKAHGISQYGIMSRDSVLTLKNHKETGLDARVVLR
jgi:hypothetical protein